MSYHGLVPGASVVPGFSGCGVRFFVAPAASRIQIVAIPVSAEVPASPIPRRERSGPIVALVEERPGDRPEAAGGADRAPAGDRIDRLRDLQRQIQEQQQRIETAYAALAEVMAERAAQLAAAAREADFSAPEWPEGIRRTVEVRFAETREVTFRFGGDEPWRTR
jgi:hypothetical protein